MFLANPFKPDLRVKREALSLVGAGHSVRIVAWDRDCRLPREEDVDGIDVIRFHIQAPYGRFIGLVPGFLRFYLGLVLLSLKDAVDVVHCHDMDTLLPGVLISWIKGTRLVYDMHESYPDFVSTFSPRFLVLLLRFLEPLLIRRADLVVVTSSMIGDIARKEGAINVLTVLNCFDPFPPFEKEAREIRESLISDGEFLIVYIGGFFAGRGLEDVVEAVSKVDGVTLFLGGYGPLENDLKSLARRIGAEKRVVFSGEINPSKVPQYDAAADLLFTMYKADDPNNILTIPNKLFESIASGKPILVSNLGEKARLVSEVGNGVVVDPSDVNSIAGAIRSLKEDPGLYEAMALAARGAQKKYNWARMAERLRDGYSSLPTRR